MGEWVDGWSKGWMDVWMDGSMNGWMDGWVNGWMDGRTVINSLARSYSGTFYCYSILYSVHCTLYRVQCLSKQDKTPVNALVVTAFKCLAKSHNYCVIAIIL